MCLSQSLTMVSSGTNILLPQDNEARMDQAKSRKHAAFLVQGWTMRSMPHMHASFPASSSILTGLMNNFLRVMIK